MFSDSPDSAPSAPRSGEKPTFEKFYEDHYFRLIRYFTGKTASLQDAEDLTGETFIYCYEHYDDYDSSKSAPATWLFLVANSRLKNHYRDRKPHSDYSEFEEWLFSDEPDMDRAVYLEQMRSFLAEALDALPERQRQVVIARFFRSESFDAIAAELNTTPGNIRTILSRTLSRLEQSLAANKNDWRE